MPYGQGQLLGAGISPQLFLQDYSGFARAGEIQGQAMQQVGAQIGDVIKKRKEEQKDAEKKVKMADQITALLEKNAPDLIPGVSDYRLKLNDPNISLAEKAAEAEALINTFNIGTQVQEFALGQKVKQAQLDQIASAPPEMAEFAVPGGTQQAIWDKGQRKWTAPDSFVDFVKGFEGFNPNAYGDYKQTSIGYGTKAKPGEKSISPEDADVRLADELSMHRSRVEKAAQDAGAALSPNQIDALTSFDFNTGAGPSLIKRFGDKPEQMISKMLEYTKAGGKTLPGLQARRQQEAALFAGQIGFTPTQTKQAETFRPATPEEAAAYGAKGGQISNLTQRFYATPQGQNININASQIPKPDTGYRNIFNERGDWLGQEMIPGGPADVKAKAGEEKAAGREEQKAIEGNVLVQDLYRSLDLYKSTIKNKGVAGAVARKGMAIIPGTPENIIQTQFVPTVESIIAKDKLNTMRQYSPTGGALGQASDKDVELLKASIGRVSAEQGPDVFIPNANRLIELTLDSIHGNSEHRLKMLKDKKITQQQFDEIEAQYPATTMTPRGEVVPRGAMPPNAEGGAGFLTPEYMQRRQEILGNQ